MGFWGGFLCGLLVIPVLAGLFVAYAFCVGKAGRLYAIADIRMHPVGDGARTHEHSYNSWIPSFVQRYRFRRDTETCVYRKLGKTPGQVWDDEVNSMTAGSDGWSDAEARMMRQYDIPEPPSHHVLFSGKTPTIDKIARAQLARGDCA